MAVDADSAPNFSVAPVTASRLCELARRPARLIGDSAHIVTSIAAIEAAAAGSFCFCTQKGEALVETLKSAPAGAVICVADSPDLAAYDGLTLIASKNPRLWFFDACNRLSETGRAAGISPHAVVAADAKIHASAAVGASAVIESGVSVGPRCQIGAGVRLLAGTILAEDVTIQANSVLGSTGLASERDEEGRHICMPHLGAVRIGAGTNIGAGTVVVRGTLRDTVVGAGCLIGNHVNVGHNVRIGNRTLVGPMTVLGGSSTVGDDCWLSPGVNLMNKVTIGDGATVGLGSIVNRDVAAGDFVVGNPARSLPKMNKYNEKA